MVILAIDYGDARTGLAVCDKEELMAFPVGVIREWSLEKTAQRAAEEAAQLGAEEIVVGNPLNMNGTAGERSQLCHRFGILVGELSGLPVTMWDERQSTMAAARYLNATDTRGKRRKSMVDAVAATIILEGYLNWRKNHFHASPSPEKDTIEEKTP